MDNRVKRVSLIIGTAGHVDHGKTSLIKALTSIDTDRLKEEKRRGLTIDLGFAYIDFTHKGDSYRAAIVDVPGHERFIKNMLVGATGMDLVLFTVAVDDGIMPQTIEHLEIIRLLGIKNVFFIITKCDLADRKRITAVEKELSVLSKATPLEDAPLFMVSTKTGAGLDTLREALAKFLITKMCEYEGQGVRRYFRLPVDRSFSIKGFGTVVTGTVAGGSLAKGDTLIEYPSGIKAKVRGLQSTHLSVSSVSTGDRSAINLSGLSSKEVKRGSCLMAPELAPFISMSPVVDCLFEFTGTMVAAKKSLNAVKDNSLIKVHHHTGEALARIRFVNTDASRPGRRTMGRLFLKRVMPMMSGDRFILRGPSLNTTVGGGRVIFSYPYRDLVPRFNRLASCRDTGKDENDGYVNFLAGALPMFFTTPARPGLSLKTLALLLNVREDNIEVFLRDNGVIDNRDFYINTGYLLNSVSVRELKKTMRALLTAFHEARPLEDGLTPEDLSVQYAASRKERYAQELRPLYRLLAEELSDSEDVELKGARLCIKGHGPGLAESESIIEKKIKGLLQRRGLSITKKEELSPLAPTVREIDDLIPYMKKKGSLISLKRGAFIGAEAVKKAREECLAYISSQGSITAGQCRDILGCGRKLAILILEYFDTQGLTIRKGDTRTLR